MWEHKPDKEETALRHYVSPKSFVSNTGHEYLYGEADHARRRAEIYMQAGGVVVLHWNKKGTKVEFGENLKNAICQGCEVPHEVSWHMGEWDHIEGGRGAQRCDCKHNGRFVCRPWHKAHHVGLRWTKHAI